MDLEFDFKGDPVGGVITKCKRDGVISITFCELITLLFSASF